LTKRLEALFREIGHEMNQRKIAVDFARQWMGWQLEVDLRRYVGSTQVCFEFGLFVSVCFFLPTVSNQGILLCLLK